MKNTLLLLLLALIFHGCSPGIGIGIPLGPVGFVGVSAHPDRGLSPTAGVRAGPVGVGVSG